jgi:hypothetical protein
MKAKAFVIEDKTELSLMDMLRFQVNLYSFKNKIRISLAQMDTLAYLAYVGEINFSDFCSEVVTEDIFTNTQTVRNFILKCIKDGLVIRSGIGNKIISLKNEVCPLCEGTIVMKLTVFHDARN